MAFKDPEKRREYARRYYYEKDREKQKRRVKARRTQLFKDYATYKSSKKCLHCGEADPICLEFHHIDPATKDIDPGLMVTHWGWTIERIVEQLEATCICLCSNCHKKIHRDLKQHYAQLNQSASRKTAGESSG